MAEPLVVLAAGGATAIVGGDSWKWRYEGEYWSDEIGTYRAFFSDKCPRASTADGGVGPTGDSDVGLP